MNDLKKMKDTFTKLGVNFTEEKHGPMQTPIRGLKWDICLYLDEGIGYTGSECIFYFIDGKYINHGCWD